ncbi:MAG: class I SAM-dependent methyltransferase [Anaerolineaceae bacterium]|nr:class I SAM-dependent methyltransferase [Anaerolineaceae bacterium]
MIPSGNAFTFVCPTCRTPLVEIGADTLFCALEGRKYIKLDGVWCFLPAEVEAKYQQFIREYAAVRSHESRGSPDPDYYRGLPFRDLTGRFSQDWRIRARSYTELIRKAVVPLERRKKQALRILDLGAGNGWLSNRLARRGHTVAAIDLQTNVEDGLGAWMHYDAAFIPIQADFDHLPFWEEQVDLVIFNASFHYSTDYGSTLAEALRVLKPDGQIVILDSPVYQNAESGKQMVREREELYRQKYGFASNAIPSENYLTFAQLERLGKQCSLHWAISHPFYGWSWEIRPLKARLLQRREPAQFRVIVGARHAA